MLRQYSLSSLFDRKSLWIFFCSESVRKEMTYKERRYSYKGDTYR
jgi:hypothetical protein